MTISENDRYKRLSATDDELTISCPPLLIPYCHKALTYVEYRAVSASSKILTSHPPLHPASVSSSSPHTKGGGYTLARGWGGWGVNTLEDAWHRIGLLHDNLSTPTALQLFVDNWAQYKLYVSSAWLFFICLSAFLSFFLCFFQPRESVSEGKVSVLEKVISR
jgi:hypothetical protein